MSRARSPRPLVLALPLLAACASAGSTTASSAPSTPRLVATVTGFSGPEAVKYDPQRDVYYVANFGGAQAGALDNDGYISLVGADGIVRDARWAAGGAKGATLHAPRGMAIAGSRLWVADNDAARAFDLATGAAAGVASFAGRDAGFLNDAAFGPDGALYLTDTQRNRIYRVDVRDPNAPVVTTAVADSALGAPNGITLDRKSGRMIVLPYGGAHTLWSWTPGTAALGTLLTGTGARYDGVEALADGRIVVSSQADSSIHVYRNGAGGPVIRGLSGRPADIAVDTKRNRVAIPYIQLNKVEIWQLP